MASPLHSPSVLSPLSSVSARSTPSSTSPPPPATSPPPNSPHNATSAPPPQATSPPPSSPPPPPPPPPSVPSSPPPASPPPTASPPPPAAASLPPAASPPPPSAASLPPAASPPPPAAASLPPAASPPQHAAASPSPAASPPPPAAAAAPPPVSTSPPPRVVSPPPPSDSSPPPTLSPPPPAAVPPAAFRPPAPNSLPPSSGSPAITVPPPSSITQPPLPPSNSSPPPPLADAPKASPSPPVQRSPPPAALPNPPSDPSAPAPESQPPSTPSPPFPPSDNSSSNSSASTPPLPSPPSPSPASPSNPSLNNASSTAVPLALISALAILSFIGVAMWFMRKRRKQGDGYNAKFILPLPIVSSDKLAPLVYHHRTGSKGKFINSTPEAGVGNSKSWFAYEELYEITNGFSDQNILGEGGFGSVYRGHLPDGREVAVKQLKAGGGQGVREFEAEVEIISRVHHRHLVSLVGYCIAENQRLLVYDYVPNNTLHYHLHVEGTPVMDWATRVKVAAGAARGIAYLHEDCHPRIIHRDIKSSNILLDNNFEAQVSDFGLARLAMDAWTHVTTRVMGTFGYLAPEYASTGKLTEKSDVYSFGVVLLELITGQKPVDSSRSLGCESLVEWARPLLSRALETGEFQELPDPRLEKNYNQSEMFRMIEAAAACVRHSAAMRPQMSKVVRVLDSLADIDLNNGVKPGQSELFNAPPSEQIRLFHQLAFGSQNSSNDLSQTSWKSGAEL